MSEPTFLGRRRPAPRTIQEHPEATRSNNQRTNQDRQ